MNYSSVITLLRAKASISAILALHQIFGQLLQVLAAHTQRFHPCNNRGEKKNQPCKDDKIRFQAAQDKTTDLCLLEDTPESSWFLPVAVVP